MVHDLLTFDGSIPATGDAIADEVAVYSSDEETGLIIDDDLKYVECLEGDAVSLHPSMNLIFDSLAEAVTEAAARGEFDEDARDARFRGVYDQATEKEQWDASYDLVDTIAKRRASMDEHHRKGEAWLEQLPEDVDLTLLPFAIGLSH